MIFLPWHILVLISSCIFVLPYFATPVVVGVYIYQVAVQLLTVQVCANPDYNFQNYVFLVGMDLVDHVEKITWRMSFLFTVNFEVAKLQRGALRVAAYYGHSRLHNI